MPNFRLPLVLIASLTLSGRLSAQDGSTLEQRLDKLAEQLEAAREEAHVPGMSIVVVKDDEIVWTRGFGFADLDAKRPADENTIYAIGSTTKAFTATLIGMLVDEGMARWDDPVTRHLPYFELKVRSQAEDAACTLRDLLSHRHGFARMSILWYGGAASREEILRTAVGAEPWDDFRANFHYCNVAYLAAGEAAGRAAESTWDELMAERFFEPLGMTSSTLSMAEAAKDPRLAVGYEWVEVRESFEREKRIELETIGPAGAVNSNVLDMAQWIRLLLGRGEIDDMRLVSAERILDTWAPQIGIGPGVSYGLGWMLQERKGRKIVEHGGNIDGFSAQVGLIPEENLGFVLLMNRSGSPLQQPSLALVFDALLDDWPATSRPEAVAGIQAVDFEEYIGTYVANFGSFRDAKFEIALNEERLSLRIPNQEPSDLDPPDEDGKWVSALSDQVAVSFQRNDQEVIVGLTIHQGSYNFEVPREGVEVVPTPPVPGLEKYVGTYARARGGRRDRIALEDGRLVYINGDQRIPLNAPDSDGFASLSVRDDQGPSFKKDAEGKVTSYVFRGQAGEQLFERLADSADSELPTLDEVLALRRTEARNTAWREKGGTRIRGEVWIAQAGVRGTITYYVEGGDRYASHMDFGRFGRIDAATNGREARTYNPMRGTKTLEGKELTQALLSNPQAVEGDWNEYFDSVEVIRNDVVDERPVHVVHLAKQDLPSRAYWIDAEHGDVVRMHYELVEGTMRIPVTVRYYEFVESAGMRRPMRVEIENPASGRTVLTFAEVEGGLELGDEVFRLEDPDEAETAKD